MVAQKVRDTKFKPFFLRIILFFLGVAVAGGIRAEVGKALWCCVAELDDPTRRDAVVPILKGLIDANDVPVLVSNNLFSCLEDSCGPNLNQHWRLYDYEHEITIMVPKIDGLDELFKNSLTRKNFTPTSFEQQKNYASEINEDTTKECLQELLTDSNRPEFFFFSGHGSLLMQDKCSDEEEFINESLQCGMRLSSLMEIYHLLDQKDAKGVFCRTCYGSNPEFGAILARQGYRFPIISMCFGDTISSFMDDGNMNDKLKNLHQSLQNISQITKNNQSAAFHALDAILDYKSQPNNIPYVLWPDERQFSLFAPNNSSNNAQDSVMRVHDNYLLTQPTVQELSLDFGAGENPLVAGGSACHTDYSIKNLTISGECDFASLAKIFNNIERAKERNYTIKNIILKGPLGIRKQRVKKYRNAEIRCTEHFTRITAKDESGKDVSASKIW